MLHFHNHNHTNHHIAIAIPIAIPIPNRHHIANAIASFLTHMFAPASCMACTFSPPRWTEETGEVVGKNDVHVHVHVHGDGDEHGDAYEDVYQDVDTNAEDGGPLCREAGIELWKVGRG